MSLHKEGLASRLKQAREACGYSQKDMAEAAGSRLRSWQDYEAGRKVPGGQVIAGLAQMGIDAHWLMTGEGTVFFHGVRRARSGTADGPDEELLRALLHLIEEVADASRATLPPARKAELILALYGLYRDTESEPERSHISGLLKAFG